MIVRSQNKELIFQTAPMMMISTSLTGEGQENAIIVDMFSMSIPIGVYKSPETARTVMNNLYAALTSGCVSYDVPEECDVKDAPVGKTPLQELYNHGWLCLRGLNILQRGGYETMEQVDAADDKELTRCRGMGRKTLANIRESIVRWKSGERYGEG